MPATESFGASRSSALAAADLEVVLLLDAAYVETVDNGEPDVQVRDLRMRYGDNDVLTGVDFDVQRGEVVWLLGPNGAGKTTTIEILEGIPPAVGGRGAGARVGTRRERRRRAGPHRGRAPVVARPSPVDARRLLTHLGGYYTPYSTPERPRPSRGEGLLDTVGLDRTRGPKDRDFVPGAATSVGRRDGDRRRPELLFLDEPTAGISPQARREFHQLVLDLVGLKHTTILLTTHDLSEAEKLADRVLILAGGRIVADGSPEELARHVASESGSRWSRRESSSSGPSGCHGVVPVALRRVRRAGRGPGGTPCQPRGRVPGPGPAARNGHGAGNRGPLRGDRRWP